MKYSIGDTVRIKATGEKIKISLVDEHDDKLPYYAVKLWWRESELKPYRPSRTGKYRNEKGQFISALDKAAQEQREHFSYRDVSDHHKFNNILVALDRIEKKIDELGRKV